MGGRARRRRVDPARVVPTREVPEHQAARDEARTHSSRRRRGVPRRLHTRDTHARRRRPDRPADAGETDMSGHMSELAVIRDALARVSVIVCELEIAETSTAYQVAC